jgi:hypothetical protein
MKLIIVAGASAIVGAVAIGLYVVTRAGAVCPVQNEAFYDHFYAKTLEVNSDTQKAAAIATYGAAVAARVVKEINERDGEVRQAYRDCVADSTFGALPGLAPLSTEEACVAIITTAAIQAAERYP